MAVGWEGSKVRLVPLDKGKHYENLLAWLNDPDVTAWTLIGDWPFSARTADEHFDKADNFERGGLTLAIEMLDGNHIGIAGIHNIDWRHGTAHTNILIGAKDRWGCGFGLDAVRLRSQYAFNVLGLRMLLTEVMSENLASLSILHKVGYFEVGRIPRRYWKRGSYRDVIMMIADRSSWERASNGLSG
ncbi:MAG TPA: GNAT family N-acetyltransferase [Acetobacteraceae bacterium]|nr:GNAT family N-acetyltransferase [Acetobacteraceae bacterium]